MSHSPGPPEAEPGQDEHGRKKGMIIADDPDWSLAIVPLLSDLCLHSILKNFEENPIFEELIPIQRDFVLERLSPSLPLRVTANLISDDVYWKRCCTERWNLCDVSNYSQSWKRMYIERHLENIIELFIPKVTEPNVILDLIPFCKNYVRRLRITQLLPPIRLPQKEVAVCDLASEDDAPPMDHFDFSILLDKLSSLEDLHVVYMVKKCGMNYDKTMFEMTDRDCESLAEALKSCKTLKGSNIEDKKCQQLAINLVDHPSLRELDFSHNLIGDEGAAAVCTLLNKSKLEILNMSNNNIQAPGAEAVAHALSENSTLLSLNLRLNRLRDEGGQAVVDALLSNSTLLHLHLGGNEMTGKTAATLAKVLAKNNTLRSINLSCNKLGVDGGKALEKAMSQNTTLTEFDIRLTEVDEQSVAFIKQAVWANLSSEQKKRAQDVRAK